MIFASTSSCRWHAPPAWRSVESANFCEVKKKKIDAIGVDNYEFDENWQYKSVRTSVHRRGRNDARKKRMRRRWRKDREVLGEVKVGKVRAAADTRNWRPKHVTAAPVGLGPAAEPMVGRSPVGVALRRCNAVCVPSSLVCSAGLCVLQAVDAAPGNPVIRSWPRICGNDGTRKWKMQKLSSLKQAKSWREWKTCKRKRWD